MRRGDAGLRCFDFLTVGSFKMSIHSKFTSTVLAGVCALMLSACASASNAPTDIADPLEGYNRAMFTFNTAVDDAVFRPIAKGYRTVVPKPVRTGVHNALTHLETPLTLSHQILQGDMEGIGRTTSRFAINTVLGLGGLIDVAGHHGLKNEPEDFGQTLAVWGVGNGPYVVLPLLPPASLRDHAGNLVDRLTDPVDLYLRNTDQEAAYYTRMGLGIVDKREQLLDVLDDLRKNSIDYYAAVRSATVQRRSALVTDSTTKGGGSDIPDYDAGQ